MKKFALMAAALLAVMLVAGCQPGTEPAPSTETSGNSGEKPATVPEPNKTSSTGKVMDASGIMYATSFEQAVADAEKEDKYVLIKFTADWCAPCHAMSDDMKKTDLSAQFAKVIPVEVDVDKEKDGAAMKNHLKDLNKQPIPYIVLIDKTGKEIATQAGQMEMPAFQAWLDKHTKA